MIMEVRGERIAVVFMPRPPWLLLILADFGASRQKMTALRELKSAALLEARSADRGALEAQKVTKSASANQKNPDNSAPYLIIVHLKHKDVFVNKHINAIH